MLWFLAILVLNTLATLRRVIWRILSWNLELMSVLILCPTKSYFDRFGRLGGTKLFGFGSSFSVFSRNCIILFASNMTRSFSGTKSKKKQCHTTFWSPYSQLLYSLFQKVLPPRNLKEANDLFCFICWISGLGVEWISRKQEKTVDIESVKHKKDLNICRHLTARAKSIWAKWAETEFLYSIERVLQIVGGVRFIEK